MEFWVFLVVVAAIYFAFQAGRTKAPIPNPYNTFNMVDTGTSIVHFSSMSAVDYWLAEKTGCVLAYQLQRDEGKWWAQDFDLSGQIGEWQKIDDPEFEHQLDLGFQRFVEAPSPPSHSDPRRFAKDIRILMSRRTNRVCEVFSLIEKRPKR